MIMENYSYLSDTISISETLGVTKGDPWLVIDPKSGIVTTSGILGTNDLDSTISQLIEKYQNRKNDYIISKDKLLVATVYKTDMFQYILDNGKGLYKLTLNSYLHFRDKVNQTHPESWVYHVFFKDMLHVQGIFNKQLDDTLDIEQTAHYAYCHSFSHSLTFTDSLDQQLLHIRKLNEPLVFYETLRWAW